MRCERSASNILANQLGCKLLIDALNVGVDAAMPLAGAAIPSADAAKPTSIG
jgi:hypothetical protein